MFGWITNCDVHMNRHHAFASFSSSPSPLGGPGLSRNEGPLGHWPGEGPGRRLEERPAHRVPRLAGQGCHHHRPGSPEGREHECHADTAAGPFFRRILRVGQGLSSQPGFASRTPPAAGPSLHELWRLFRQVLGYFVLACGVAFWLYWVPTKLYNEHENFLAEKLEGDSVTSKSKFCLFLCCAAEDAMTNRSS